MRAYGRVARSVVLVGVLVAVVVTVAGTGSTAGSGQARWVITDLGTLGGTVSEAVALNERGQVVGWSELETGRSRRHAFLWENGKSRDLGTLGRDADSDMPNLSQAVAINARGQILGNSSVDQNTPVSYAFVWQNGRMTAVTPAGGTKNSYASAINEHGQVVGWSGYDYGFLRGRAFLWQSGKTRDLGTLPGRGHSWANALNERGQVVGDSYAIDDQQGGEQVRMRAFLWQKGRMTDLGTLRGGKESDALAINERGQIIGTSSASDSTHQRGFVWQNGKMTDLGGLSPVAINDRGQVIAQRAGHAFLWQNGKITALGSLGGGTSQAVAINEHGQVVGFSTTRSGATHAFIWQTGRMSDLGSLPGQTESKAVAVDEHNRVVGESNAANPPFAASNVRHAVLWTLKTDS